MVSWFSHMPRHSSLVLCLVSSYVHLVELQRSLYVNLGDRHEGICNFPTIKSPRPTLKEFAASNSLINLWSTSGTILGLSPPFSSLRVIFTHGAVFPILHFWNPAILRAQSHYAEGLFQSGVRLVSHSLSSSSSGTT